MGQNVRSIDITFLGGIVFLRFEGKGFLSDLINDGVFCRTALATPGLLFIDSLLVKIIYVFKCTV